jgi:hypothetical protein
MQAFNLPARTLQEAAGRSQETLSCLSYVSTLCAASRRNIARNSIIYQALRDVINVPENDKFQIT